MKAIDEMILANKLERQAKPKIKTLDQQFFLCEFNLVNNFRPVFSVNLRQFKTGV